MSVPRTYPHGVPSWVDTQQPDPEAAQRFYSGLFGWSFTEAGPGYLIATLHGKDVAGLAPSTGDATWNTYLAVDSADDTVAAARANGGEVVAEPEDAGPGGRAAAIRDPQGAEFGLWQARKRLGAQWVNGPGGWNFSDLHTPDPTAAVAFYSALFGWNPAGFAGNDEEGGMVSVPGYGDHLAAGADPDIYERQKNAPPGFADVIGAVVPTEPGDPAQWHVSFSVADRDASTDTVRDLGGEVVALTESMWARLALIRDPGGAEFTLSQFSPPDGF